MNSTSPPTHLVLRAMTPPPLSIAFLCAALAFATLAGCGRKIGDDCSLNTDCSATGDRTCDMSQPGGYCTIEGCDQSSCPDDSACVRFFPDQFLSKGCNPACEDTDPPPRAATPSKCPAQMPACTPPSMRTDDCAADELCLPSGQCAPRASERRICVKTCGGNGDCRGGYECRAGGTLGSLPLLGNACSAVSFCAPKVK